MAHLDLQTGRYAAADTLLNGRDSRRIGHNTTLHRTYSGIAVRYHAADIYSMTADGWATVDTDGWRTVTTMSRVNALLPGPWAIYSGRGTSWLYRSGRKVTPFVDGLQVNVGTTATGATDAVGMGGAILLTAADVDAIVAAEDAAEAARADKRTARLLREHSTAGGPRTHTRSLYERRARGCDRCTAELAAEREARMAALAAEHAAGLHETDPTASYWERGGCPWGCPDRTGMAVY